MIGKIVCDLPIVKTIARSNNGGFVELLDGRILLAYNRNTGLPNANGGNCFVGVYSSDHGRTWSQPQVLLTNASDPNARLLSASFMRLMDGGLAIFYIVHRSVHDSFLHMSVSRDEGATWSPAHPCMPCSGYYVTNNDRVVRLASGRLISAGSHHDSGSSSASKSSADSRNVRGGAISYFFYSDDDGRTWNMSRNAVALNIPASQSGLQEPGMVELHPGIIWGYGRTDLGRHYEFFSFDNGNSWTEPEPSLFTGPCSPLLIKRNPFDNSLMAVWNPIPSYISMEHDFSSLLCRFRLVCSVSMDNGAHWREPVVLENDLNGEFSHPAVHFTDCGALIAYDVTLSNRSIERIRFVRYDEL